MCYDYLYALLLSQASLRSNIYNDKVLPGLAAATQGVCLFAGPRRVPRKTKIFGKHNAETRLRTGGLKYFDEMFCRLT